LSFYTGAKKIMKSKSISQMKEVVNETIKRMQKSVFLMPSNNCRSHSFWRRIKQS